MSRSLLARPLTADSFAPFGHVLQAEGSDFRLINNGNCRRYDDLAPVETAGPAARALVSIFRAEPYAFPLRLTMVERHPLGSQAFMPLTPRPFLVVVCADGPQGPARPEAFVTAPGQGVSYPRGRWHAVLTPIGAQQDFLVVDRGGDGSNLEEFHFKEPWEISIPQGLGA